MATANSPVGTYEIVVTGGEAKNYTLNYVNGTLTIETPSVINSLITEEKAAVPIYTPSGQRLSAPRKGVNIIGGRKVVVK